MTSLFCFLKNSLVQHSHHHFFIASLTHLLKKWFFLCLFTILLLLLSIIILFFSAAPVVVVVVVVVPAGSAQTALCPASLFRSRQFAKTFLRRVERSSSGPLPNSSHQNSCFGDSPSCYLPGQAIPVSCFPTEPGKASFLPLDPSSPSDRHSSLSDHNSSSASQTDALNVVDSDSVSLTSPRMHTTLLAAPSPAPTLLCQVVISRQLCPGSSPECPERAAADQMT